MSGPLAGITIVEFAGLGPAPFAAMMLADHGATVIRIDRPGASHDPWDPLLRSRKSVTLDLKQPEDVVRCTALCAAADGLIEGFRPGVMERLGLGPDELIAANPGLVYGRMTGWGQTGPYSRMAGHDINYIAVSGVLGTIGREGEKPLPPLNLVGDFGGGGMMLAFAMVSALLAVRGGASGQVIDCAMTEGSALLAAMTWGFRANGSWQEQRGVNLLDTGAPYYETYETADGHHIALGCIEPQFYAAFCKAAEVASDPLFDRQDDPALWPRQKAALCAVFRQRTRAEWVSAFAETDACFSPVLTMSEALEDAHNRDRGSFVDVGGFVQPAPAPRYSATPCAMPFPAPVPGADNGCLPDAGSAGKIVQ